MDQRTDVDQSAVRIQALYSPRADGSPPLALPGMLPARSREGAPKWEYSARQRMHNLLKPACRVSAAEERVLRDAGIPLVAREQGGGFTIDPNVTRASEKASVQARVASATNIAKLYGLAPDSERLVPPGMLPARSREGAPKWEYSARQRMHNLLKPAYRVSAAEERVLRDAGIPLVAREQGGGFTIDPNVTRASEKASVQARVASATNIAKLYGLAPDSERLVPPGMLPARSREGAPKWEYSARQRMHNLLKPAYRVSAAEERVLRDAGIPLVAREQGGGFTIDPNVTRASEKASVQARVASATNIAKLYGLAPDSERLVPPDMGPSPVKVGTRLLITRRA
ncbi:hypothetical protein [Streptomyces sp. NBC_01462]|uniref:hypothetical protein n=1 Tax=Streptomyces sp. NBC_01462 TaxID=2903876 RepID=UPI002E3446DD|nr:hypothetical protein [Streptomyces sp. NBC_01462]